MTQKKGQKHRMYPHWHKLVIVIWAFLLYANTLGHDYAQDDAIVIYDNMFTTQGIQGIPGLLANDTFYGFFKEEGKSNLVSGGRYRPLTPVMFAFEYEIFGKNPFIGHFINVILYALLGLTLYLTLQLLFKFRKEAWVPVLIFGTSLLYITHPIHTEVVANIKGRDEIMSMWGSLLALYAILRSLQDKQVKWLILGALAFFGALLSKENAITFLAVVPVALMLFRDLKPGQAVRTCWPLFAAAVLFLIIRSAILGFDFGGTPRELMNNPFLKWENGMWVDFGFGEKMATILYTLGKYLQLLVFPHPLSHDYYPRAIPIMTFGNFLVIIALLAHIVLVYIAIKYFKHKRYLSFGIIFYLLTLSIVSNIVFPIGTNMSERFMFMPSLGFALAITWLITRFVPSRFVLWTLFGVAVLYSLKTVTRNVVWKDDYTLFTSDVSSTTQSAKLLNAAGGAISSRVSTMEEGPERTALVNQAIEYLQRAIDIHPTYRNAWLLLGNSYYYAGRYNEAITNYEKVLRMSPGYAEALKNYPIILREAAKNAGQKQRNYDLAEKWLLKSLEMQPNDFETNRLLGITYGIKGQHDKAIEYFNKALKIKPDAAVVHASLGTAWLNKGDRQRANQYFQRAQELDPNALNHLKK